MSSPERSGAPGRNGEPRLPMALAVLLTALLVFVIPHKFRLSDATHGGFATLVILFLVVLVIGDPGRIDRPSGWLRTTTGVMIALITVATGTAAIRLVIGILSGRRSTALELLTAGGVVWVMNVIAFGLWYWQLDSGGPVARALGSLTARPAFRFPEQDIGTLAADGWYPQFIDYLWLSFCTATAFGGSDTVAVRHWSKMWLMAEASLSLALVTLVIARAVNVM